MKIPDRIKFTMPSDEEVHEYMEICNSIENAVHTKSDFSSMIEQWNSRCEREYEPIEFTTYYGASSTEVFVREALLPTPVKISDLTYEEIFSVFDAVLSGDLTEPELSYYLSWLDVNFPNSNISDLIYWPDQWFNDEKLLQLELSTEQIIAYAMIASTREFDEVPKVELPLPVPNRPVIQL